MEIETTNPLFKNHSDLASIITLMRNNRVEHLKLEGLEIKLFKPEPTPLTPEKPPTDEELLFWSAKE